MNIQVKEWARSTAGRPMSWRLWFQKNQFDIYLELQLEELIELRDKINEVLEK